MTSGELLQKMKSGGHPSATCIRYEYVWHLNGEPCGRAVKTLERKGLVECMYFSGGRASANLTDKGRAQ